MQHRIRTPDGTAVVDLTPGRAVRLRCLECQGWEAGEVHECGGDELLSGDSCGFYRYRLGKGRPSVKTIHKECIRCMGGVPGRTRNPIASRMVEDCRSILCPVWPYRDGSNPKMKGRPITAARKALKRHAIRAPRLQEALELKM